MRFKKGAAFVGNRERQAPGRVADSDVPVVFRGFDSKVIRMQRIILLLCLAWMTVLPARALTPLTFDQFSALDNEKLDPYITDYFKRYPQQQGSEKIVRDFFLNYPPNLLMPRLQKNAPIFYAGIKAKATAAQEGKPKSNYTLDDFLKLPDGEYREIATITGPFLHGLLTDPASKAGLQALVHKENRALEVAFMLVQTRAQQTTAEAFAADLAQIMSGLAQMRQAADRVN